jgi:hypothetical protein
MTLGLHETPCSLAIPGNCLIYLKGLYLILPVNLKESE